MNTCNTAVLTLILLGFSLKCFAQAYLTEVLHSSDVYPGALLDVGDFDGDGDLDHLHARSVVLFENGERTETIFWDSSYVLSEAFVGDLNADGADDLVGRFGNTTFGFFNDGDGHFSIILLSTEYNLIFGLQDADDDGDLDLLLHVRSAGFGLDDIGFLQNNGTSEAWLFQSLTGPDYIDDLNSSILLDDVDKDGLEELVFVYNDSLNVFRIQDHTLSLEYRWKTPEINGPVDLAIADLGQPGLFDLAIVQNYNCIVFVCDTNTSVLTPIPSLNSSVPNTLDLCDLNNDGLDDFFIRMGQEASLKLSLDTLIYEELPVASHLIESIPYANVHKLDHDSDGQPDLVFSKDDQERIWDLQAEGDEIFDVPIFSGMLVEVSTILQADLNGDGLPDILIPDIKKSTLVVFWQNANGSFQAPEVLVEAQGAIELLVSTASLSGIGTNLYFVVQDQGLWRAQISEEGEWLDSEFLRELGGYSQMRLADINGDEVKDICFLGANQFNFQTALINQDGQVSDFKIHTIGLTDNDGQIEAMDHSFIDWDSDGDADYVFLKRQYEQRSLQLVINQDDFSAPEPLTIQEFGEFSGEIAALDFAKANPLDDNWYCLILLDDQLKIYKLVQENLQLLYELQLQSSSPIKPRFVRDFNQDGNMDVLLHNRLLLSNMDANDYYPIDLNIAESLSILQAMPATDPDQQNQLIACGTIGHLYLYGIELGTALVRSQIESSFCIYPNPACSVLNIDWASEQAVKAVRIYNSSSSLVYESGYLPGKQLSVPVDHLPAGLYHCELKTLHSSYFQKFMLLR